MPELLPLALDLSQIATGAFFAIAGYHKLTNASSAAMMRRMMVKTGLPHPEFFYWWVSGWELAGGLMVMSGHWLATLIGAAALLVVCAVACLTDGRQRLKEKHPLDRLDRFNEIFYLPEVLYIVLLAIAAARAADEGVKIIF